MGGIVREKASGPSSLTLSLPISRARLLGVRAGVGVLEAIALGVVPWTTIFLVSSLARMPILISQVAFYVMLLVGGGLAYFSMAVLVFFLVGSAETTPAVGFCVVILASSAFRVLLPPFFTYWVVTS